MLTKGGRFLGSSNASYQVDGAISDIVRSSDHDLPHYVYGSRLRCIDTPGEAVYILAGVAYLIPLIALFSRFFYKAYVKTAVRSSGATKTTTVAGVGYPEAKCIGGTSG